MMLVFFFNFVRFFLIGTEINLGNILLGFLMNCFIRTYRISDSIEILIYFFMQKAFKGRLNLFSK